MPAGWGAAAAAVVVVVLAQIPQTLDAGHPGLMRSMMAGRGPLLGVAPGDRLKYPAVAKPCDNFTCHTGNFTCLGGNQTIPARYVNDDSCGAAPHPTPCPTPPHSPLATAGRLRGWQRRALDLGLPGRQVLLPQQPAHAALPQLLPRRRRGVRLLRRQRRAQARALRE